ncbi:Kinase-like protein [Mycena venus]|uniref:Kinase-like protein n=1 Tax=Mycena venus TaxID=2733690 RepID=A0A8H6Z0U4_9AGAR|nr:Kinase-like protein [Mycena venus]
MENVHTSPEGSGERHLPGYFGSHDKQAAWFSDDHTHRHFWSPVCFSSSSASTEYWSTHTSPFAAPRARLSLSDKDVSSETSHLTRTATNGEKFNDPPQSAGTHTLGWSSDAVSFSALDVRSFSGLDPLLDDFCFPKSLPDASWSPVCLSSPSASTEYSSFNPTPRASLPTLVAHLPQTSPDNQIGENPRKLDATNAAFHVPSLPDTSTWCEKLPWSEPLLLEGCTTRHCESSISSEDYVVEDGSCIEPTLETPDEHVEFLSQDQVDKNVREMTCGPRLEEHFWPIRYKIRSGTLQLYENTLHALIIQARKELHPAMHGRLSKLTDESAASHAIETSSSSLTWFLDGSRNLYERLWQIADELRATELQQFKEAVWKDSLIIILVLYEILTSKTDLEHIMKLRGIKAQFMLDLMQDTIRTHIDLVDLRRGGAPRIRGVRRIFLRNIIDLGLLQNVDRPSAQLDVRRLIVQLSEVSDLLPSSLTIHGVQNTSPMPLAGGNFGDIYTAQYQGGTVALKRLRLFQAESDESLRIRRKFWIGTIIELVVQSIRKRRRPLQDVDLLDAPLEKRPKIV